LSKFKIKKSAQKCDDDSGRKYVKRAKQNSTLTRAKGSGTKRKMIIKGWEPQGYG